MSKEQQRKRENWQAGQEIRRRAEEQIRNAHWNADPVKQYVRNVGWLNVVREYISRRGKHGVTSPLKFLTLPGEKALDIGFFYLSGVLRKSDEGKLNVAICDKHHATTVASNLEALGGVLAFSARNLADELQQVQGNLARQFPFDVINLDFCDQLMAPTRTVGLDIVDWIFRYQRGQSFLLLLTTRPDPDAKANDRLLTLLRDNLNEERRFKDEYLKHFGTDDESACTHDSTLFTQLVMPKHIARLARRWGYRLVEPFAACYQRPTLDEDVDPYDMICNSFELEPIHVRARQDSVKYEPRFPIVPRSHHEDGIFCELPVTVRNSADSAYSEFVSTLPGRNRVRVEDVMREDPKLNKELEAEAEGLEQWMERV